MKICGSIFLHAEIKTNRLRECERIPAIVRADMSGQAAKSGVPAFRVSYSAAGMG